MPYVTLGSVTQSGVADTTGLNTGNWTVSFTQSAWTINVPYFELYHAYVALSTGVVFSGSTGQFQVWLNRHPWDFITGSANNGWDPAQPMILRPSDELDFFFSTSHSVGTAPQVTAWLRYDITFDTVSAAWS
jgi:hypothetical protein